MFRATTILLQTPVSRHTVGRTAADVGNARALSYQSPKPSHAYAVAPLPMVSLNPLQPILHDITHRATKRPREVESESESDEDEDAWDTSEGAEIDGNEKQDVKWASVVGKKKYGNLKFLKLDH